MSGIWRVPGTLLVWKMVLWPFAKAGQLVSYFGLDLLMNRGAAPKPFYEHFREKYVNTGTDPGLPFFEGSFEAACTEARTHFRFLLVYLHSEAHHNTERFCKETFQNPGILHLILDHYVLWGASVLTSEGYHYSQTLQASTYPFLAVIAHSGTQKQLVMVLQGDLTVDVIVTRLHECINNAGALLVAARADEEERQTREKLRHDQEREYEETQRKDMERLEARRKQEEEARLQKEREEQAIRELEERQRQKEQEELQLQEKLRLIRAEKLAALAPEPPAGPEAATLKITLPTGGTVTRRFALSDKLSQVLEFVCTQPCWGGQPLALFAYPARALDATRTLQEEQLYPRAVVIVKEVEPSQ
eukprot:RCo018687